MTAYTFRLDEAEIDRFRAMAANAERHERALWQRAGIVEGASVVDLGCGPGALLPLLATLVGSQGMVVGVDNDPVAAATARQVADSLDVATHVVCADGAATGLPAGAADVVMCRNVLVHYGPRVGEFLAHAATLLRPGGHLISVEPDVAGIDFGTAYAERAYEQRWAAMMRADGSDPSLGRGDRLPRLLRDHGWHVVDALAWTDRLVIDKSPAWAAADAIVRREFATRVELAEWRRALEERRAAGPLRCSLTMTAVLATPNIHARALADGHNDTTLGDR